MVLSPLIVEAHFRLSFPAPPQTVERHSCPLFSLPTVATVRPLAQNHDRPFSILPGRFRLGRKGPFPDYFSIPPKPFRINTYKSVTKQITLTSFRMNTYEKHRGEGVLLLTKHPMRMLILSERSESKDLSLFPRDAMPLYLALFRPLTSNLRHNPPAQAQHPRPIPARGRIQ
jgi:hypothetical protein